MNFKELLATQKRVFGFLWPYWKVAVAALFFTVVVALLRLSQAKFIKWLFDLMEVGESKPAPAQPDPVSQFESVRWLQDHLPEIQVVNHDDPIGSLQFIIVAFIGVVIARGFSSFLQKYLTDLAAQSAIRDLRERAFAHLQSLSMQFFESMRLGEIQSRCTSDIIAATGIYANLSDFLKNFLIIVAALAYMFYTDWQLTLLVLMLSPLIGVAVGKFGKKMGHETEKLQSRVADLSAIIIENTSSQKVVKAYHREDFEIKRFNDVNRENFRTQMKLVQVMATQTPVVEFISVIGIIAIVYFGASRILIGDTSLGGMVEYWALMAMIIQPVTAISGFYSNLQASSAAANRVFKVLDLEPKVQDKVDAVTLPTIQGELVFENVHFSYDESKEILRGIDLKVSAGEVVAIVGTNGAGKTTFVNLVPRFYDPSKGSVCIDGHNLKDVTIGSLRTQVGTVIQESVLFAGTIADNIACGRSDFTREEIVEAAKVANADMFIRKMSHGYDTDIGERGVRLSGGQRQRIAIARALLRNPKILILDEFTSGIDTESENLITEAIERIMRGRTSLVIAHRLNTIRHADRIIVLDAGKIVEEGTHDKLLEKNGLYTKLYEAQLRTPVGLVESERKGA
jgi:ATP-binding cassette, subfamily B, bacterial MsbA